VIALLLAIALEMKCAGVWAPATTEQALIATYGRANVTREMVYIAEGDETPGTILFANDPARRAEIVWKDQRRYARPEWVRIPRESTWTAFGVRNGMTLAEIEKLNGRAFHLSGFDWDYGGMVTNWRGGSMDTIGGKTCRVSVEFEATYPENPTKADEAAAEATGGDRQLISSSPHVKRMKPRVAEIIVSY
jgi:hypothetical protein